MPLSYVKSNVDATVNVNSTAIDSADYNYSNEALTVMNIHAYLALYSTACKKLRARVSSLTIT